MPPQKLNIKNVKININVVLIKKYSSIAMQGKRKLCGCHTRFFFNLKKYQFFDRRKKLYKIENRVFQESSEIPFNTKQVVGKRPLRTFRGERKEIFLRRNPWSQLLYLIINTGCLNPIQMKIFFYNCSAKQDRDTKF